PPQRSAFGVHLQLLANDRLGHARRDVLLQAVGQRDQEVVDTLLFDDLRKKLTGLPTLVLAQKATHRLQRDISLKIQLHVVDEVPDKFLHETAPWETVARLTYSPLWNPGARSLLSFS